MHAMHKTVKLPPNPCACTILLADAGLKRMADGEMRHGDDDDDDDCRGGCVSGSAQERATIRLSDCSPST